MTLLLPRLIARGWAQLTEDACEVSLLLVHVTRGAEEQDWYTQLHRQLALLDAENYHLQFVSVQWRPGERRAQRKDIDALRIEQSHQRALHQAHADFWRHHGARRVVAQSRHRAPGRSRNGNVA